MTARLVLLCLGAVPVCGAYAHHGFGPFDVSRDIELTGTITGVDFINPHSWLHLDVMQADGSVVPYRCELRSASVLNLSGWTSELFVVGETITVQGSPSRVEPTDCYTSTLIFADGRTLDRYGQVEQTSDDEFADRAPRLPNGDPNISGIWAAEQIVMTDPRGQSGTMARLSIARELPDGALPDGQIALPGTRDFDLFQLAVGLLRIMHGATTLESAFLGTSSGLRPIELTPRGEAESAEFFSNNDTWLCSSNMLLFGGPGNESATRITQQDDTVVIEYGLLERPRTVHLDLDDHPPGLEPSRIGHSIGRWEDDVLIVDTIGFTPGVLMSGRLHGEQLHIVETYQLDADALTLTRELTFSDPEYLVGEYHNTETMNLTASEFRRLQCRDLTSVTD